MKSQEHAVVVRRSDDFQITNKRKRERLKENLVRDNWERLKDRSLS